MERAIDLREGIVYVVTDLHGGWLPYVRLRDNFLRLYDSGQVDKLIIMGDLIHGYGSAEDDASLHMVLDVMRLQNELGRDTVIMLMGNHELPHIYGVPLSKGDTIFTPRFERAMGNDRQRIVEFFKSLPFFVRTAGGVLFTHAGASTSTATTEAAEHLLTFSHDAMLAEADRLLARQDVSRLLDEYGQSLNADYDEMAEMYLAVEGEEDPRYYDLLRGFIVSNLTPEWNQLWDLFFTQCERAHLGMYPKVLERFLSCYSTPEMEQRVLVTGHIKVRGGYEIIAGRQVRLASWSHATPSHKGAHLIVDVSQQVEIGEDLEPYIYQIP